MRIPDTELPSDRSFGLFAAAVAGGISVWLAARVSVAVALPVLVLAGVCGLLAIVRPSWLRMLNRAWMGLGLLLGRLVSPIVLALLFFGLITPIALVLRLAGRDELRLKAGTGGTFWRDRDPPGPSPASFQRQF